MRELAFHAGVLFCSGAILACCLFTAWILLGIRRYGDLIVFEPSKPLLLLEIGLAVWAACSAALFLAYCLYKAVRACQR